MPVSSVTATGSTWVDVYSVPTNMPDVTTPLGSKGTSSVGPGRQ